MCLKISENSLKKKKTNKNFLTKLILRNGARKKIWEKPPEKVRVRVSVNVRVRARGVFFESFFPLNPEEHLQTAVSKILTVKFDFLKTTGLTLMFSWEVFKNFSRSSRWQMFFKISVLKTFATFTGKHLCWSLCLIKL